MSTPAMTTEPVPAASEPPPPYDLPAEQAVLGAMLLSPAAITDVSGIVRPDDFYRPAHALLATRIIDRAEAGEPVDAVTAPDAFTAGELARVGGAPYLHTLMASVPTAVNAGYYAQIVVKQSRRRAAMRAGQRLMQISAENLPDEDTAALDERVRGTLDLYDAEVTSLSTGPAKIGADFDAWLDEKLDGQPPRALSTGLADLDRVTDVRPGELVVVAARPRVGKTLLMLKLALHTASRGEPVLMYSLEMTRGELLDRLVAAYCRVNHDHLRDKTLTDEEATLIARHRDELAALPLYVEDASVLTMPQIAATAQDYQRRHGIELVTIDYLGLVQTDSREANRERQVAEMSAASKALAKQLAVPVVLACQINRGPESRPDKTPQLSDLRESGAIEADANQVWLLHRPELYASDGERMLPENHPGELHIEVAKNRGRATGGAWCAFRGRHQDLGNLHRN